jgi:hypothetical protein
MSYFRKLPWVPPHEHEDYRRYENLPYHPSVDHYFYKKIGERESGPVHRLVSNALYSKNVPMSMSTDLSAEILHDRPARAFFEIGKSAKRLRSQIATLAVDAHEFTTRNKEIVKKGEYEARVSARNIRNPLERKRALNAIDLNKVAFNAVANPCATRGFRRSTAECTGGDINRSLGDGRCLKPCKSNQRRDELTWKCKSIGKKSVLKRPRRRSRSKKTSRRRSKSRMKSPRRFRRKSSRRSRVKSRRKSSRRSRVKSRKRSRRKSRK